MISKLLKIASKENSSKPLNNSSSRIPPKLPPIRYSPNVPAMYSSTQYSNLFSTATSLNSNNRLKASKQYRNLLIPSSGSSCTIKFKSHLVSPRSSFGRYRLTVNWRIRSTAVKNWICSRGFRMSSAGASESLEAGRFWTRHVVRNCCWMWR
uniref:(northern house mosquito) hypothetical protein n=1 Tax=Culex pipiens TaxID=7175 RepID=A0A8D8DP79_CULPI